MSEERHAGTIKWFIARKDPGFNGRGDSGEAFVDFSGLLLEGYKLREENQIIEFSSLIGPNGLQAFNVIPIE